MSAPAINTDATAFTQPTAVCRSLGVRYSCLTRERVEARYTVTSLHLQPAELLHGGVNCLIGEEVASMAAWLNAPPGYGAVGTHITLNHVASAVEGDAVVVTARPLHIGATTQLWEIKAEKEVSGGTGRKLLSIGDMQAFVKQPRQNSKL